MAVARRGRAPLRRGDQRRARGRRPGLPRPGGGADLSLATELDDLYGAPLEEFVARRNALAKALRKEGKNDEADDVAARRKPSASAWVVNRLARDERKAITALVRAVESVKAGKSGAEARYREAADELTRAARSVLERHGKRPTDALLRDVATTLRAAAASEPQLLVSGKLEAAIEPTGFDAMAGATLRAPARRKEPTQRSENDVALEQARAAVEEARTEARRLRRAADDTAREADRAKAAADKADARLKRAEERLARAAAEAASRSDARRAPRR